MALPSQGSRQLLQPFHTHRPPPPKPPISFQSFFKRKKQPIPVNIRARDWPAAVRAAVESTYMTPPTGSCVTVRVARASMSAEQTAENVVAALAGIAAHVPKQWANVQAVYLKSSQSVALPLWQTLPDVPSRIPAGVETGGP